MSLKLKWPCQRSGYPVGQLSVLAGHYGFTDEELDFIINYDIKYRMGRESEAEEE
ncbi:MAG: hypothetical protein HY644_06900 [Acidobacteria bacterium]|nr:hypothetical protein [Acidobacteriota bacterium]